jgi:hypothetical protein
MSGSEDSNKIPQSPHTKGIIQHFTRQVQLHTEGLDNDLHVTNDKIGQLETAQLTTSKLTGLEASVAHMDKSLALLNRFDDFHTKDKERHNEDKKDEERVEDNYDEEYTADTERDDQMLIIGVVYAIIVEVSVVTADVRYPIIMMLSARLNLKYLLLMVSMILMHTLLGKLPLTKSLHVTIFLRILVLGLILVSLPILPPFGG